MQNHFLASRSLNTLFFWLHCFLLVAGLIYWLHNSISTITTQTLFETLSDPTIGTWEGIAETVPMQAIGVDMRALKADMLQFSLMGEAVTAVKADNTSFNPNGWAGSLAEDPTSSVVLYGKGETMTGKIQHKGQHYHISKQGNTHQLI